MTVPTRAQLILADYDWAEQEVAGVWRASGGSLADVGAWSVGEIVLAADVLEAERLIQDASKPKE